MASGYRNNTAVRFTGAKSPTTNLAIDSKQDSFFLYLTRVELKTTGSLKCRHGNLVTTSSRAENAPHFYSLKPISFFTYRKPPS